MGKVVLEVEDGITMINKHDDGTYNVQFTPNDSDLGELITEFREFLLACGYGKETIESYIEEF